jgi:antitoxin ChpS
MVAVDVRKQGGAAIITIPSVILKRLELEIGTTLELEVQEHTLLARPVIKTKPKRYRLAELLQGASEENIKALNAQTDWAREGSPTGRELI